MNMILKVFKLKICQIAKIITAKWNSHTDADSKKLNVDNDKFSYLGQEINNGVWI